MQETENIRGTKQVGDITEKGRKKKVVKKEVGEIKKLKDGRREKPLAY